MIMRTYENAMAVSINWGPFCGTPYHRSPTILGYMLEPLIFTPTCP